MKDITFFRYNDPSTLLCNAEEDVELNGKERRAALGEQGRKERKI